MAAIRLDNRTGLYYLRQVVRGQRLYLSLDTDDDRNAEIAAGKIRERIWQLGKGLVVLPDGSDWVLWIKTGSTTAVTSTGTTLGEIIDSYSAARPSGSTAVSTRDTEDIHLRHLKRILKDRTPLPSIDAAALRRYVDARLLEEVRGSTVTGPTIRKELYVFRRLWRYAASAGIVSGDAPTSTLVIPKSRAKDPFATFAEITELVKTVIPGRAQELWECCVLDQSEIAEFLEHVRAACPSDWFYPAIMACAYAGIRRSEWMRSRVEDWHLKTGKLTVRERKRVHDKHGSLRTIDIHPKLSECVKAYLKCHPGGSVMFCFRRNEEISRNTAADRWTNVMIGSKWKHLNGYHTLRHSFASNLAAADVSEHLIDRWMGHQTKEQRDRYRHFFPSQRNSAIALLDYKKAGKRSSAKS